MMWQIIKNVCHNILVKFLEFGSYNGFKKNRQSHEKLLRGLTVVSTGLTIQRIFNYIYTFFKLLPNLHPLWQLQPEPNTWIQSKYFNFENSHNFQACRVMWRLFGWSTNQLCRTNTQISSSGQWQCLCIMTLGYWHHLMLGYIC